MSESDREPYCEGRGGGERQGEGEVKRWRGLARMRNTEAGIRWGGEVVMVSRDLPRDYREVGDRDERDRPLLQYVSPGDIGWGAAR